MYEIIQNKDPIDIMNETRVPILIINGLRSNFGTIPRNKFYNKNLTDIEINNMRFTIEEINFKNIYELLIKS